MLLAHGQNLQKDVITFNSAMSSLEHVPAMSPWQCAPQILTKLRCSDLRPTVVTCSTAMSVVGSWALALQFLATAELQMDVVMYSAGMNACGKCQEPGYYLVDLSGSPWCKQLIWLVICYGANHYLWFVVDHYSWLRWIEQ